MAAVETVMTFYCEDAAEVEEATSRLTEAWPDGTLEVNGLVVKMTVELGDDPLTSTSE